MHWARGTTNVNINLWRYPYEGKRFTLKTWLGVVVHDISEGVKRGIRVFIPSSGAVLSEWVPGEGNFTDPERREWTMPHFGP